MSIDYWMQQADPWAADAFGEPVTLLLPGGAERAVTGIVERMTETSHV